MASKSGTDETRTEMKERLYKLMDELFRESEYSDPLSVPGYTRIENFAIESLRKENAIENLCKENFSKGIVAKKVTKVRELIRNNPRISESNQRTFKCVLSKGI